MNHATLRRLTFSGICWVVALTVLSFGDVQAEVAPVDPAGPITSVSVVRELTLDQAISQPDVVIEGVVCTRDGFQGSLFLHDGEFPIYVAYPNAGSLQTGNFVRVRGHVNSGHVNHLLVASSVEVLDEQRPLPAPLRLGVSELSLSKHDCQWVHLDDLTVEVAIVRSDSTTLYCSQGGRPFLVGINGTLTPEEWEKLYGAKVSVTGNCGVYWEGNEVKSVAIYIDASYLETTKTPTEHLQDLPYSKVAHLWGNDELTQFRAKGKLTYFERYGMFLEGETGGTWFRFLRPLYHLSPGETVEVFGQRQGDSGKGSVLLDAQVLHIQRSGRLEKLSPVNIEEIRKEHESRRTCLQGRLIKYEVEVCERRKCEVTNLLLEQNGKRFIVEVQADVAKHNSFNLSTARFVSATGPITFSNPVDGCILRLFAQSFSDIEIPERRQVWSIKRVAIVSAIGTLGLVCCLVWGMRHRISDLRRGQELLGLSAQLRSSYDSIRDAIIIVDDKRNILAANRKAKEFFDFEFEPGQLKAASSVTFGEPRSCGGFAKTWDDLNQDFDLTIEANLEIEDPQARTLEVFTAPVDNTGHQAQARLWAFYDVTERQRLQANLSHAQKQEAIGRLAGGLAHDFNNLLTGINGNLFVSMIDKTKTIGEVMENLDAAQGATLRAGELVSNLLGFSQKLPLNKRPICVNAVLRRMEPLLRPSIPNSIRLDFQLGDSLPRTFADPVQLEQVLLNICLNARDSIMQTEADSGVIDVTTSAEQVSNGEQCVRISIRDTGCGISRELLPHVFEPFYTTKGNKGTGLGLSMSLGIIQQHQGQIEVESQHGEGTTFIVSVPAPLPSDPNPLRVMGPLRDRSNSSSVPVNHQPLKQLAGKRVLVIDDEASIRKLLKKVLATENLIVSTAKNGEEAIRLLKQSTKIDLAILDWKMPELGGLATLQWIKQHKADLAVIACSGHAFEMEQDLEGSECAPDFVLQKPFGLTALVAIVREALCESSSPDSTPHFPGPNKAAIDSSLHR